LRFLAKERFKGFGCESNTQPKKVGLETEKGGEKMQTLIRYLRDHRGVETLEWILIGGLITGVGLVLYPGVLQGGLTTAITTITGAITGAIP
jgi:Flp pilus assembly pilin Flp